MVRSFGTLVQRKIKKRIKEVKEFEWLYTPQELVQMLLKGPLAELYIAIYYTVHGYFKIS